MRNIQACLTSNSDKWSTPKSLYKYYIDQGYFDPCPISPSFDGLVIEWKEKNFVNPPYSNISAWVDKCISEFCKNKIIHLLIPARTDTKWFRKLVNCPFCKISFIEGRLKFGNSNKCAPFPSMLVFFDWRLVFTPKFTYIKKEERKNYYL